MQLHECIHILEAAAIAKLKQKNPRGDEAQCLSNELDSMLADVNQLLATQMSQ
ncbi:hypothetical protein MKW94_028927, partial [Papaver nudicaule]|nr:hypothetical protein [Papaver nudicaule]